MWPQTNCLTNAWYQVHPAGSLVPHILWSFCPCFLLRPLLQSYSTSRRRLGKRADENHDHRNDCPAKLYPRALFRISPPHVPRRTTTVGARLKPYTQLVPYCYVG